MSVLTPTTPLAPPRTAAILGVPIALTTYAQTLDWIDSAVMSTPVGAHNGYICVAAVHTIMAAQEDPELRSAVKGASFTVPDGRPLVWALKLLGHPLPDRVYGPELMARACARATSQSDGAMMTAGRDAAASTQATKFYLYGGRDQAALDLLKSKLLERYPGLEIVGSYCPPFRPLLANEEQAIIDDINSSGADVVWVGIGVPKQEKWMAQMRPRLNTPVLIGVGAAFDFHAGLVAQAPAWMQRVGLEWLFRLSREPRRLWRRYLRYNPWFVVAFARQFVGSLRHRLSSS